MRDDYDNYDDEDTRDKTNDHEYDEAGNREDEETGDRWEICLACNGRGYIEEETNPHTGDYVRICCGGCNGRGEVRY